MMWLVLIAGIVIAVPLIIERNRRDMDDAARGAGPGQFADLPLGVTHYQWHGPADGPAINCIHGLTYTHTKTVIKVLYSTYSLHRIAKTLPRFALSGHWR